MADERAGNRAASASEDWRASIAEIGDVPRGASPDPSSGEEFDARRKRRRRIIVALVIVAAFALAGAVLWQLALGGRDGFFDPHAQTGQAPYKTQEEIQAELDRIVDEGMFNISIVSVIQFDDGASCGTAYIENVPGNRYLMQVAIALDDTGEVVYESGALKPGSYIEDIELARDLDAGSYLATATFSALDQESHEEVGKAAAKVTIDVLG